ncbi:MAG: hypothetical protein IJ189_02145 [Clostridia bacterium]|nr:hypothetical protein [Clostridia bacterium]
MNRYSPFDTRFLRVGRYNKQADVYGLWWSGSGLVMKLGCAQLEVEAESTARDHTSWLGVLLDGAPVARLPLRKGRHRYMLLSGMDETVTHEITVLRDTQPSYDEDGPVLLHAVYTDGVLEAAENRPLMIEFLGDSLTVGEGTLGPVSAQEWRMPLISHMPAFPTLVSEKLHAEKRVIALGGWGVYKSWDCNHDSRIGRIYEELCGITPGGDGPYDFQERPADAVVINLGTNDGSAFSKADPAEMKTEEANLIQDVKILLAMVRKHQKKAHIFWAYGLCGVQMTDVLQKAVQAYREETDDQNVSFLPLPDANGDVGSRSHPSRAAHEKAAAVIVNAIRGMMDEE